MLSNKTILLTGATDGIGYQTASSLAKLNAELILLGKNQPKGKKIKEYLISESKNNQIYYFNADFTSFSQIENVAQEIYRNFNKLDVLINNAGVYQKQKIILNNGLERTFMINYLAPFTLSLKLLDLLKKSHYAKILNVSSMVHASSINFDNLNGEKNYSGDAAYSLTKLCNILFSYKLAAHLKSARIAVNALHPGVINTKLLRAGWGAFGASPKEGAERILFLIKNPVFVTGKYFENDKKTTSASISYDAHIQEKLWDYSLNKANQFLQNQLKI